MQETTSNCPICNSESRFLNSLSGAAIAGSLGSLFGDPSASKLRIGDYSMAECPACQLNFASPMHPGDDAFYSWVTTRPGYYTAERWEWSETLRHLPAVSGQGRLLDVGCGAGAFLEVARGAAGWTASGIDTTQESIAECRKKGLDAHVASLTDAAAIFPKGFQAITAFHVLEHVADPKRFVRECLALLAPQGALFIATPLYPASSEEGWIDPLNGPPHHLTRWAMRSYASLADALGLEAEFHLPAEERFAIRLLRIYRLSLSTPYASLGSSRRKRLVGTVLGPVLHPVKASSLFIKQLRRKKHDGRTLPDVVLVKFTRR